MANTVIGAGSCGDYSNTGVGTCTVEPQKWAFAVVVPLGTVIPNSALVSNSDFSTYVLAKFKLDNTNLRWKMLPFMTLEKDDTAETSTEDRQGYKIPVQENPYDLTYQLRTTICGYKKAYGAAHNKQDTKALFFIDESGTWEMTQATDSTSLAGGGSFPMASIWVPNWKQQTASTANMYKIRFLFQNTTQLGQNVIFMKAGLMGDAATMQLMDVTLQTGTTANTATHVYVSGKVGCGGTTVGSIGLDTLASTSVWLVKNATTGAAITVSAASYNLINDQYDLTITSSAGLGVTVAMAAPSVLVPLGFYMVNEVPDKLTVTLP